jgi:predicted GNAT family acetyltransferase
MGPLKESIMDLSKLSVAKRDLVRDAIAAGYVAEHGEVCLDLVRRSKHEKPRVLAGLRIWEAGSAFDVTLDLSVSKAVRSVDDMRQLLGLELLREEEVVGALTALGEDVTTERVAEIWDAKSVTAVPQKGRAAVVLQMVADVVRDLSHLPVMLECMSIRQGEHPGWGGDSVLNASAFVERFGMREPDRAAALAEDLITRKQKFSDELGISPARVEFYAARLREGVEKALSGSPSAAYEQARLATPRDLASSLQAQLGVSIYRDNWEPGLGPVGTMKATYRVREPGGREVAKAIVYRSPEGEFDVSDIGVRQERLRGRGIGAALIDHVFLDTAAPHLRASTGFTGDGLRFFTRYGMATVEGRGAVRRPPRVGPAESVPVFDKDVQSLDM